MVKGANGFGGGGGGVLPEPLLEPLPPEAVVLFLPAVIFLLEP